MISLLEYINNTIEEYITIFDSDNINEMTEEIFPNGKKSGKMIITVGTHARERGQQRNVSDREIIDAIFGAYNEIRSKYKTGEIFTDKYAGAGKNGVGCKIIITDTRKSKTEPVCVVCFIQKMLGLGEDSTSNKNTKWTKPVFAVKTVFKGDDFSGSINSTNKNAKKIFLY